MAAGDARGVAVEAARDLERGPQQEAADPQAERLEGVLRGRRWSPHRGVRRPVGLGVRRSRGDLRCTCVASCLLWRPRPRRWRGRCRTRGPGLALRGLLFAGCAGGVEACLARARRRWCDGWHHRSRERARRAEMLRVPRVGQRRLQWRGCGCLCACIGDKQEMDECRRQRRRRESKTLGATARQLRSPLHNASRRRSRTAWRRARGRRQPATGRGPVAGG